MTVRLNRLQRAGLIERLPNPRDGRGVLVRLTPIGKDLAEDALAMLLATQEASLGTLQPAEQAALGDLLRTLLKGLGDTPAFRPAIAVQRGQS
jgi:DNA-binding MarR family transcriptional regulator